MARLGPNPSRTSAKKKFVASSARPACLKDRSDLCVIGVGLEGLGDAQANPETAKRFQSESGGLCCARLERHHPADRFPAFHHLESLVDVIERHHVGEHWVDLDFALLVPVDALRHIGAAARAAEGGAFPDAPGDELERAR